MSNRTIKFRVWTGARMEYAVMVGHLGAFYCPELDPRDKASMTPMNTRYGDNTPVMQFTGLHDKNGKEIYEGDVVTTDYPTVRNMADNWLVEYGHTGMFQLARGSFKESIHDLVYNDWKLEVIGNLYEAPELLNSDQPPSEHSTSKSASPKAPPDQEDKDSE